MSSFRLDIEGVVALNSDPGCSGRGSALRTTRTFLVSSASLPRIIFLRRNKRNVPLTLSIHSWEPATSFQGGSEHFIQHFWGRVNTSGRDPEKINDFKADEEFFPSGPPRESESSLPL